MHHKALWPVTKKANRGFRGYPLITVGFYGPDNRRASKVAVGVVKTAGAEAVILDRRFADEHDIRDVAEVTSAILDLIERHDAKTVVMLDRIIGCPHEEGTDYPLGQTCPACPFWANRNRWTGQVLE